VDKIGFQGKSPIVDDQVLAKFVDKIGCQGKLLIAYAKENKSIVDE